MTVLYCNAFDISYNGDVFFLTFKFEDGEGAGEKVCIVISDKGVKSLHEALSSNITKNLAEDVTPWDNKKTQENMKLKNDRYIS